MDLTVFEKEFLQKYDNGHTFTDEEIYEMERNLPLYRAITEHIITSSIVGCLTIYYTAGNRFFKTTRLKNLETGDFDILLHSPIEVEFKYDTPITNQNKNSKTQPTSTYDNVENPSHYTQGRVYEPKDVIRDWELNFNLGSAVKYISRAGRKNDKIEDLKKAKQFLEFEIEYLEKNNES